MTEDELVRGLEMRRHDEAIRVLCEFLVQRRKKYRDKLEAANNDELRGRAKECKELLAILS